MPGSRTKSGDKSRALHTLAEIAIGPPRRVFHFLADQRKGRQDVSELFLGQPVQMSDHPVEFRPQLRPLRLIRHAVVVAVQPTSLAKSSKSGVVQISLAARSTIGAKAASCAVNRGTGTP